MFWEDTIQPMKKNTGICYFKKSHQWFLLRNTALIYPFSEQMGNSGPGKGWVQIHKETQWQCHSRMAGIISSPSISPNKTDCLLVFRRGGPCTDLWRWAFKWVFPVAHKASFACPMLSMGASVDPLVLSPVFITKGKVSGQGGPPQQSWTHILGSSQLCLCWSKFLWLLNGI